jgi:hypothetical protein
MYDWRSDEMNLKKYGSVTPPMYNIANFGKGLANGAEKIPTAIFYGGRDFLASDEGKCIAVAHMLMY